jgi:hypothetical protein
MSDRDTGHTLLELREARAEVDRLRRAIERHRDAMREYKGAEFDLALWEAIGPLPGGE